MKGEYFLNAKKQQLKGKTSLGVYLGQGRLLEHLKGPDGENPIHWRVSCVVAFFFLSSPPPILSLAFCMLRTWGCDDIKSVDFSSLCIYTFRKCMCSIYLWSFPVLLPKHFKSMKCLKPSKVHFPHIKIVLTVRFPGPKNKSVYEFHEDSPAMLLWPTEVGLRLEWIKTKQ